MILFTSFLASRAEGQTCDCSLAPTFECIEMGSQTFGDLVGDELLSYASALTTPQDIVIVDYINFDDSNPDPYVFAPGSRIFMLPGTSMFINKSVVFDGVSIYGCASRWDQIKVLSGGNLKVMDSNIANGCKGIILESGSSAEIISTDFFNNGHCIQISGTVKLLGEGISHNLFDDAGYGSNLCTGIGSSRYAITLNNVPHINIGNPSESGAPNVFNGYNGISATNSNIDLYNSIFEDRITGTAILLRGVGGVHTAKLNGLGNTDMSVPFVTNCRFGVDAKNYNLLVKNAFFNVMEELAILVTGSAIPSSLQIEDNRFETYRNNGLFVSNSSFSSVNIEDNDFIDNKDESWENEDDSYTSSGINWVNNQIVGTTPNAVFIDNLFSDAEKTGDLFPYEVHGIRILSSSNLTIEYNSFEQDYNSEEIHQFQGVFSANSSNNEITNNEFVGNHGPMLISGALDNIYTGVHMSESGNNLVACNIAENLNRGFRFRGPACDQTTFRHNNMEDNLAGLYLAPGTIINRQFEHENKWLGGLPMDGIAEAVFDGSPSDDYLEMSLFSINSSNSNSVYWANPRLPADDWFVDSEGEESNILYCFRTLPLPPSASDEKILAEAFEAYKGYPASEWEATLRAFATLDKNPSLRSGTGVGPSFYALHDTANIGKLYRAMEDWNNIGYLTSGFEYDWRMNVDAISRKLDTIALYVADMETTPDTAQGAIAVALGLLYADVAAMQDDNANLSDEYLSDVADRAVQLDSDLGNIVVTEPWEHNLKTVLTILVERFQETESTEWTSAQYDTLLSIADQCRHEGGIGVVWARAAIEQFDYDDEALCPGESERISSTAAVARLQATISPNPATDRCRITFDRPMNGTLVVRNMHGTALRSMQVSNTSVLGLDTGNLPAGLYIIEAQTADGQQFLTRLAISR